ncbi:hypothetical protein [Microvirga makkahensis]|uniref:Uncharacterized protein n=1 Tax=Microvirga makkahensis TaxID=1128670 RepID=A0A7X3MMV0_9HYPH|nr:hypothetical protein [Microvirga makkahensis]MXQ09959.1 hypothetical protein [Microvirga makkahensis]
MAAQRSRLSWDSKGYQGEDRQLRPRVPLIPALVGTLALLNIASTVLALVE